MQILDKLFVFTDRLVDTEYMITGSMATIVYGAPRMTHDVDIVLALSAEQLESFVKKFPLDDFYCPPIEVLRIESGRREHGHFNLIHHESGFRADCYFKGKDPLHAWALNKRTQMNVDGHLLWVAPPEYVILRKLEYYREGGSEKHIQDIENVLRNVGSKIDIEFLKQHAQRLGISDILEKQIN